MQHLKYTNFVTAGIAWVLMVCGHFNMCASSRGCRMHYNGGCRCHCMREGVYILQTNIQGSLHTHQGHSGVCAWLHNFAASFARVRTLESPIPLQVWGYLLLKESEWGFNFIYNVLVCVVCCCMLLYIDLQSVQPHALTAYNILSYKSPDRLTQRERLQPSLMSRCS